MRIVTAKTNDYLKTLNYEALAAGVTSGVWSEETEHSDGQNKSARMQESTKDH